MEAVVGLLVMLLAVSHGVEIYCDGRQDGAQCYRALGGTVVLQLMDSASETLSYRWTNKEGTVFNWQQNKIVFNVIQNRSHFTPSNGTFSIYNLSRNDSDKYTLRIFDSNGQQLKPRTLQLTIQAPVSSVLLVSECLSQGEMRVSCSSEGGDSPHYSWTIDGHTLTDAELLSENNETNSIILKQHVSGHLICSVRNNVSSVSEKKKISNCGFIFINCTLPNATHISQWVFAANNTLCIEPTTAPTTITETSTEGKETDNTINPCTNITSSNQNVTPPSNDDQWFIRQVLPIMAGVLSALVFLLLVGVAVTCAYKKKQNNKPKEEDDQELMYADVRIVQRQGRQMQQTAETEVEYGQVKFSERPRRTVKPAGDECVYATVHKGR